MSGCRVDCTAMRADAGNISHLGEGVEVKDADVPGRAGAGDIKIAAIRVGGDVVETAIAAHELNLENLVGAVVLCLNVARNYERRG